MPKKTNSFYGATLYAATVGSYYPSPGFDHFIFQQMLEDGTKNNDDFTLIAYAVDVNGVVLNNSNPIPVIALNTSPFVLSKQNVQFANTKLGLDGLAILYPGGVITDVTIVPTKYYKKTGYVCYTATAPDFENPLTPHSITLNPSPPA